MKQYVIFFFSIFLTLKASSQEVEIRNNTLLLGLNYGQSTQSKFPFNNSDYLHHTKYLKIQINYLLGKKKKFSFELNIEPSIYYSKHQLLNKHFIQPGRGIDYLEQRERFIKKISFVEYAINFGVIIRYKIINNFSTYFLGSIGPMISTQDTERLRKGFAFSDILGFGFSYKLENISFDVRSTLRHTSNANLYAPNNGHNSIGIEAGILFHLK